MKITICRDDDRRKWTDLVAASDDATSGHWWEWRDVITGAYGFQPHYMLAEDAEGRAIAAIPFVHVRTMIYGSELASMPYLEFGGICHRSDSSVAHRAEADQAIWAHSTELAQALRTRRLHVRSPYPCAPRFETSLEKVSQHLALADNPDEQMRRLPSERRNRLRKCAKLGLDAEVTDPRDERAFQEFYAIYAENQRDLGSPTHSAGFFSQIASRLASKFQLILIRRDGVAYAAAMATEFRGVLSIPWSGATTAARSLYATNALYWEAIKLGIERRCHTFDFGRSSQGSGIFEFKRQWGPMARQCFWGTIYLNGATRQPRQRSELQMVSSFWKMMPLAVANLVGPSLRKGISN